MIDWHIGFEGKVLSQVFVANGEDFRDGPDNSWIGFRIHFGIHTPVVSVHAKPNIESLQLYYGRCFYLSHGSGFL